MILCFSSGIEGGACSGRLFCVRRSFDRIDPPEVYPPSAAPAGQRLVKGDQGGQARHRDGGQAGFLISRPSQIGFTFDGAGRGRKDAEKHNIHLDAGNKMG